MQIKPSTPYSKKVIPKVAQKELSDLLGEKNVCFTRDLLSVYRAGGWGTWFHQSVAPHGVVQPETVEDVQAIVKIANKFKIPVLPVATGMEAICWEGGLVVDTYARMRKIHKIDIDSGYALIEPGVTNGQLLRVLRPQGFWVSFGSFPPTLSALSTQACSKTFTNIIGKEDESVRGVEVVLPTGEIIRTGTAGLGFDWWSQDRAFPDLTHLFVPSTGTMGIITKAAVRIHPLGEAQDIVIVGFNNFDKALDWTNKVTRQIMVNTSMIWNYHWVSWQNWAHLGGKGYFDYINQMLTLKPWEAPKGFYTDYAFASISGYKEQVEGNVKASQRLAKQLGGDIITEEFKDQWPGVWKKWKHSFVEHKNSGMTKRLSHIYGIEGSEQSFVLETNIRDGKKFHHSFMKILYKKYGIRHARYYTRQYDHGRSTFLRYVWMHDKFDQDILNREIKTQRELIKWIYSKEFAEKFPNVKKFPEAIPFDGLKYSPMGLWNRIQKMVDPNSIMYPVGSTRVTKTLEEQRKGNLYGT